MNCCSECIYWHNDGNPYEAYCDQDIDYHYDFSCPYYQSEEDYEFEKVDRDYELSQDLYFDK